MDYKMLDRLSFPDDLKKLSINELETLAEEIRLFLINSVSETGGHLASNLGVVELTIAMHYVFDSPRDQFVFDVGHQSYVHKILTGRKDGFATLRRKDGLSGFPNPEESAHDPFKMGHSSTSLSLGLGLSSADHINGNKDFVVSLIGDGAMTGGMVYEALCNVKNTKNNLIVILNDNKMSISKNVGFMARYLAKIRAKPRYYKFKDGTKGFLQKIPIIGKSLSAFVSFVKTRFKMLIYHANMFENFGLTYLGPTDGHDLKEMISVL
ncbi:MAG: 1-deoxy-D-xylulose-5-phosphate synthase, partial [Clostridia bacterium]|nr:1-deoxy-D-xylulose-5-phosphate synthase [Clostridia bacterium]